MACREGAGGGKPVFLEDRWAQPRLMPWERFWIEAMVRAVLAPRPQEEVESVFQPPPVVLWEVMEQVEPFG